MQDCRFNNVYIVYTLYSRVYSTSELSYLSGWKPCKWMQLLSLCPPCLQPLVIKYTAIRLHLHKKFPKQILFTFKSIKFLVLSLLLKFRHLQNLYFKCEVWVVGCGGKWLIITAGGHRPHLDLLAASETEPDSRQTPPCTRPSLGSQTSSTAPGLPDSQLQSERLL